MDRRRAKRISQAVTRVMQARSAVDEFRRMWDKQQPWKARRGSVSEALELGVASANAEKKQSDATLAVMRSGVAQDRAMRLIQLAVDGGWDTNQVEREVTTAAAA